MSVGIVVLTLRIEKINVLEGVVANYVVLKLQGTKLETHHSFHPLLHGGKRCERCFNKLTRAVFIHPWWTFP
jgi:hypothetical protein